MEGIIEKVKKILNVCGKLKLISTLKMGDRINTTTMLVEKNTVFSSILRTFVYRSECRDKTLLFIENTISSALDIMARNKDTELEYYNERIACKLRKACQGILNLKITYISDKSTVDKLDSIVRDTLIRINIDKRD